MGFGWTSSKVSFDWWTLVGNKDKEIDRLNKAYIRNLEGAGAELILERATVEDANTVRLASGAKVRAASMPCDTAHIFPDHPAGNGRPVTTTCGKTGSERCWLPRLA